MTLVCIKFSESQFHSHLVLDTSLLWNAALYLIEYCPVSLHPQTRCHKVCPRCENWSINRHCQVLHGKNKSTLIENHCYLLNNYNNMCTYRSTNHSSFHSDFILANRSHVVWLNVKLMITCKGPKSFLETRVRRCQPSSITPHKSSAFHRQSTKQPLLFYHLVINNHYIPAIVM